MKKQNSRNLDTLFAIEFGQLLENHLLVRSNRDELKGILCSSLGLKNENQLAQVFAGYDTPSTANIFELIRTLNDQEFTNRFLNLQTTLMGVSKDDINVERKTNKIVPKEAEDVISENTISEEKMLLNEDSELGDIDFDLLAD